MKTVCLLQISYHGEMLCSTVAIYFSNYEMNSQGKMNGGEGG